MKNFPVRGLAPVVDSRPFAVLACFAAGLPFELLTALKLSNKAHLSMLLPLGAAFVVSSRKDPFSELMLIPLLSTAVILIVRLIITISNSSIDRT